MDRSTRILALEKEMAKQDKLIKALEKRVKELEEAVRKLTGVKKKLNKEQVVTYEDMLARKKALVGKTAKGVDFSEDRYYVYKTGWVHDMEKFVGLEGRIREYREDTDNFLLSFSTFSKAWYPAELILDQFD